MELREIFVTALAIMNERGRSAGGSEILWTRDWGHLRELLMEGLKLVDRAGEIIGTVDTGDGEPAIVGDGDPTLREHEDPTTIDRGLDDGAYARGRRG